MERDDDRGAMDDVREGMAVHDADGTHIGSVDAVQFGDPEAVTSEGQSTDPGMLGELARLFAGGPGVPNQYAEQLMRTGYVKVDVQGPVR